MSKADALGGSATFDAVAQPMSSRAASFAAFAGQTGEPPANPTAAQNETPCVPVDRLAPNPYNPRATLAAIEEMADSLTGKGVIQPLTVVTRDAFLAAHPEHASDLKAADYVVVDGNRRLAGARLAGLDDLPVHVNDSLAEDADTLLETALTAAVQHEDLEPLDEARALQRLVEVHGSQRAVARSLGKSSGWVTQRIALLNLTPELKQAVSEKTMPLDVARTVGQLPEQQQHSAAEQALSQRAAKKRERTKKTELPPSSRTDGAAQQTAEAAEKQSAHATVDSDDELQALAQELRSRLTPEQVEKLIELLMG
ncbi:ParB/RepB/Spo0J family partition protein [Streptomyces scabiei]|uniref:ParB/RepB/Spo0J family partition protein n=1 Tax=Streptomyces scabiei TaxID=1930 RepID=UPI0029BB6FC4|nr:ParB/RepB/Spo0J family partition protein [Streptomyces scabiei]MDX2997248.1 ParB/RepB/Spo0J family partition protein [Streptomyces scabiei]MDX3028500.1 ParB/RepB/Spo0J family partition protein [Streptomyces scabiei]